MTSDRGSTAKVASLYDMDYTAIRDVVAEQGQPEYRARQVWEWLYKHLAADLNDMTNLPQALRDSLAAQVTVGAPAVVSTMRSADGETRKDLLRLVDGETVEVVLMLYERRRTACISTQVGCSIGCAFCATGQMGLRRNLSSGEIVAQALHCARLLRAEGESLTNVVLMGMGEPLLNYDATLAAIRRLIDPSGFGLGQRHITLSTAGVVPGIRRLAEEALQITLAVSLHAATDRLRDELVPLNRRYPLDALFEACYDYVQRTGRRVSFEWALIEGLNDSPEQGEALAARLVGLLAHVNLIPLNPTPGYPGRPSSQAGIARFTEVLDRRHVPYTLRVRRGIDIQAGCGQLRQRAAGRKSTRKP